MTAYGNDTDLETYATERGVTLTGTPAFLRQMGTDYIDGTYWWDFKGSPLTDDNAFPRTGSTVVPDRVDRATYEAALLYDADPDALTAGSVSNNGSGAIASEKVDVISVSYHAANSSTMEDNATLDNAPRYDVIENILRPLLIRGTGYGGAAFVV